MPFQIIGILLLVFAVLYPIQQTRADESNGNIVQRCHAGFKLFNPAAGQTLKGMIPVELGVSSGTEKIEKVTFRTDTSFLGEANTNTANSNHWFMDWDSRSVANGSYSIFGLVRNNDGSKCRTEAVPVTVANSTASRAQLVVELRPLRWQGPTNVSFAFTAQAKLKNNDGVVDVSDRVQFVWSTTVGTLQPSGKSAHFFSGPAVGKGEVVVVVSYGSQSANAKMAVEVVSQEQVKYPSPDKADDATCVNGATGECEDAEQDVPNGSDGVVVEGDSGIAECIRKLFGDERYKQLLESGKRVNFSEFKQVQACFAQRRFVVPTSLSPIEPAKVQELIEDRATKIKGIKNVQSTVMDDQQALELSGEASPESVVILYVFSEPLVLTTTADSSGQWSYTLEDPLEPGDHEAYIVVEGEDGEFVRSASFGFAVAQAEASPENPNGYSLDLTATTPDDSQVTASYLIGVGLVIIAALIVVVRLVWRKKLGKTEASTTTVTPDKSATS